MHYVVVAGTFDKQKDAIVAAKHLSSSLRLPLADASLRDPTQTVAYLGTVVSMHQPNRRSYVLTAYLGRDIDAGRALLRSVKRLVPKARLAQHRVTNEDALDTSFVAFSQTHVIVLGSFKHCADAMRAARTIAQTAKVPFTTRGLVCDKRRGLIWPDDYKADELYAGSYFGRRYNSCGDLAACISVERAEFYSFRKGLYIVIGGLYDANAVKQALARYRKTVPTAYAKQTSIYLGCAH